jgi:hypothetical protein
MVKRIKNRNTKKKHINKQIRKTRRRRYDMKPIYGGQSGYDVNVQRAKKGFVGRMYDATKDSFNTMAQGVDKRNKNNKISLEERVNTYGTGDWAKASFVGAVRNTSDAANKVLGKDVDERPGPKQMFDVAGTLRSGARNLVKGVSAAKNAVSNRLSKKSPAEKAIPTSSYRDTGNNGSFTEEEKKKIIDELQKLLLTDKISETEFEHAVTQLNKTYKVGDSIVALMSPIQSIVKVIGDWITQPIDIDDINGRQTVVKLLQVPSSSMTFVKGVLGENSKSFNGLNDHILLVYDAHNTPADKIASDILGTDNLLANVINSCIGPGCKDPSARLNPEPRLIDTIEVVDNVNKKKLIKEIEMNKAKAEEETAKDTEIRNENAIAGAQLGRHKT